MAAAVGAAIVYGAAYPATAVALRSFSPIAIAGLSCTLALLLVIGLAAAGAVQRPEVGVLTRGRLGRLAVLAVLGGVGFIVVVNLAVQASGPTITGFVAPLYAIFATLFAVPILGERVRPSMFVAFALALVGTSMLAGAVPTGVPVSGVAMALGGAAMFGLYLVLARRWGARHRLDGTLVTLANLLSRGPILLAAALVIQPSGVLPSEPDPAAVVALLTIAFGSSTAGSLLVLASVKRVPSGRTSAALLLTPVASAVIAAVLLGERLSPLGLAGACLILGGMALASGLVSWRRAVRVAVD